MDIFELKFELDLMVYYASHKHFKWYWRYLIRKNIVKLNKKIVVKK